jgi:hypothetical protein
MQEGKSEVDQLGKEILAGVTNNNPLSKEDLIKRLNELSEEDIIAFQKWIANGPLWTIPDSQNILDDRLRPLSRGALRGLGIQSGPSGRTPSEGSAGTRGGPGRQSGHGDGPSRRQRGGRRPGGHRQ